jgi:hypothetical protein
MEKGMNKKILIGGSAVAVVVLVLASLSSVIGYNSVELSAKGSPLFSVRSKRATDEKQVSLTCEYIGKRTEITIPFPIQDDRTALLQKIMDIIIMMDDKTFDRFIDLVIHRFYQEDVIKKGNNEKVVALLHLFRTSSEAINDVFDGETENDVTSEQYISICPWTPGCWIYNILSEIIIGLVLLYLYIKYFISLRTGCLTLDEECNPCFLRLPLTI